MAPRTNLPSTNPAAFSGTWPLGCVTSATSARGVCSPASLRSLSALSARTFRFMDSDYAPGSYAAPMPKAHDQQVTNHYSIHFPAHEPRASDPAYHAFNAYRRKHVAEAVCYVGARVGFDQCADAKGRAMLKQPGSPGLELHHKILEFSLINEVDLEALQRDFPDLTDPVKVTAWAESDANFMWLCTKHHRGYGGAHHAAYADFEASIYVKDLIGGGS